MPMFCKKPVVIEARQLRNDDLDVADIAMWCGGRIVDADDHDDYGRYGPGARLIINTLDGALLAREGDWIICGIEGEFYPCKPNIFDATYEPMD